MKPTPEQANFASAVVNGNDGEAIILEAVAGSGKTTSLMLPIKELSNKRSVIIAFNKTIATELQERLVKMGVPNNQAQAGTCHSYGLRAYRKGNGHIKVDSNKLYNIVEEYFEQNAELPFEMKAMIRKLVSIGKQAGAGIKFDFVDMSGWLELIRHYDINDSEAITDLEIAKHSANVLRRSNKMRNVIDFDDMIYLPLLQNLKFDTFDVVMIDEAQDVNWVRREMAGKMLEPGGRLIAVGDRKQAIYGFTGAGSDSLDQIKTKFNAKEMPLTVCFRCDKKIIEFAQQWNPVIQPFEGAAEGEVTEMEMEIFMKEKLTANEVMLCRNTKPLVQTAFSLIRNGVACYVEGRDIGQGLKKLAQKWKVKKIDTLVERLEKWKERETAKARDANNDAKVQYVEDQYDTLMVIVERCQATGKHELRDVIEEIDYLFRDTREGGKPNCFTLSTVHKAKGKEWNTVYWLDRAGTLPSKYAKQAWQLEQEANLCYVAATRAKHKLVEVLI